MPPVWDTASQTQGYLKERQVTNNLQKTLLDNIMQRARLNETVNSRIAQMGQRQKDRDSREQIISNEIDFKRSESKSRIKQAGIARDFQTDEADKRRSFDESLFIKKKKATEARDEKLYSMEIEATTDKRAYDEKIAAEKQEKLDEKEKRLKWENILHGEDIKGTPKQIDTAIRTQGIDEVIRLSGKKGKSSLSDPGNIREEIDSLVSRLSKTSSPDEIRSLNIKLNSLNKALGYSEEKTRIENVDKVLKSSETDLGVKLDALIKANISPSNKEYIKIKKNYLSGMKGLEKSVNLLRKVSSSSQRTIEDELDISVENVTGGFIQGDFMTDPISKFVPGWKKVLNKRFKEMPSLDKWVPDSDEFVSAMNDEAKRITEYLMKENYAEGMIHSAGLKIAEGIGWIGGSKRMPIHRENKRTEVENNIYNLLLDAYGSNIGK